MAERDFVAREGGIAVVFDVAEAELRDISSAVAAGGFAVRRYYPPHCEHAPGGSGVGMVRLAAEVASMDLSDHSVAQVVAQFEALQSSHQFKCTRVGTDTWAAGDHGETTG